jgi:hypothetical protein
VQRSKIRLYRVLVVFIIGILLQTTPLSQSCLDTSKHPTKIAIESANDTANAPSDAGCCPSCFCCHVAGVLDSKALGASLIVGGFLPPSWDPPALQFSIGPSDKPPRV